MAVTVEEIYEQTIKPLSAAQRLQLATMILTDISPRAVVDYSEEWSDEDLSDFATSSWSHIGKALGPEAESGA